MKIKEEMNITYLSSSDKNIMLLNPLSANCLFSVKENIYCRLILLVTNMHSIFITRAKSYSFFNVIIKYRFLIFLKLQHNKKYN